MLNVHYAARQFDRQFTNDPFGAACSACDRLWFRSNLSAVRDSFKPLLKNVFPGQDVHSFLLYSMCRTSLNSNRVARLSRSHGFRYPDIPSHVKPLNQISERMVSPRVPFMRVRHLQYAGGQFGIVGEVANVPVSVPDMVYALPCTVHDDHAINVNLKRRLSSKTGYMHGTVTRSQIWEWLRVLCDSNLYRCYGITVDEELLEQCMTEVQNERDEIEVLDPDCINVHDCVDAALAMTTNQGTLVWDEQR